MGKGGWGLICNSKATLITLLVFVKNLNDSVFVNYEDDTGVKLSTITLLLVSSLHCVGGLAFSLVWPAHVSLNISVCNLCDEIRV